MTTQNGTGIYKCGFDIIYIPVFIRKTRKGQKKREIVIRNKQRERMYLYYDGWVHGKGLFAVSETGSESEIFVNNLE